MSRDEKAPNKFVCTDITSKPQTFSRHENGFHPPSRQRGGLQGPRADDDGEVAMHIQYLELTARQIFQTKTAHRPPDCVILGYGLIT